VLPLLDIAAVQAADLARATELTAALPVGWALPGGFRVQLRCESEAVRDGLQRHLARHRIYAPVHWRQDRSGWWSGDDEAAGWAARLLTVPVDHRCDPADVRRIAAVLAEFSGRAGNGRPAPAGSASRPASRTSAGR
jgi:dTDP-4-amino-4,6-dideoxygalactose transaminase